MIRRISSLLADTVVKTKKISNQEREIYEYCLYVVFNHLIYALIMLFTGIITHRFYISFIFLLTLIPLRMFFGGAHASKPWICTFLSYGIGVLLIVIIPNYYNYIPEFIMPVLMLMSMIPIILLAPVDNKRKCFSPQQRKNLRIKGLLFLHFIILSFVLFFRFELKNLYGTIAFCVMICSINILLGSLQKRKDVAK